MLGAMQVPILRSYVKETSPRSGGRSVGIVSLRTEGHGVCLFFLFYVKETYGVTLNLPTK
jgi:hypothetical protein